MSADEAIPRSLDMAGSPAEFERLFDAALDAVIAMDSDGAVAAWNRTADAEIILPESLRAGGRE